MSLKRRIIYSILGSLVILVVVAVLVIVPSIRQIKTIAEQIYLERVDLEERYQRGQSLKKSQAEFKKNEDRLNILSTILIQKDEELKLLNQLEELAKQNNVLLEKQLTDPANAPIVDNTFKALSLELSISGNYLDIVHLIDQLEQLDIYLNLEELTFSQIAPTKKKNLADINLETYNVAAKLSGKAFWQAEAIYTPTESEKIIDEEANAGTAAEEEATNIENESIDPAVETSETTE